MIRTKKFTEYGTAENLDKQINSWFNTLTDRYTTNWKLIDIKYAAHYNVRYGNIYSALIIYDDDEAWYIPQKQEIDDEVKPILETMD